MNGMCSQYEPGLMFILLFAALCLPIDTFTRTTLNVQVKLGRKQYWKKNRKWSLFPIVYTPPPRPPRPSSDAIRLYVFSLSTCIVLAAEVKALDILMLLFQTSHHIPQSLF